MNLEPPVAEPTFNSNSRMNHVLWNPKIGIDLPSTGGNEISTLHLARFGSCSRIPRFRTVVEPLVCGILPSPFSTRASKAFSLSSVRSTRPTTAFVSFVFRCDVLFVRRLSRRCVRGERTISGASWKGSKLRGTKEKTCRMEEKEEKEIPSSSCHGSRSLRKDRHVSSFEKATNDDVPSIATVRNRRIRIHRGSQFGRDRKPRKKKRDIGCRFLPVVWEGIDLSVSPSFPLEVPQDAIHPIGGERSGGVDDVVQRVVCVCRDATHVPMGREGSEGDLGEEGISEGETWGSWIRSRSRGRERARCDRERIPSPPSRTCLSTDGKTPKPSGPPPRFPFATEQGGSRGGSAAASSGLRPVLRISFRTRVRHRSEASLDPDAAASILRRSNDWRTSPFERWREKVRTEDDLQRDEMKESES